MLHTTTAFDNFVKFYLPHESDCKLLRRIECAVRGEELYRTFSSTLPSVAKLLYAVFDYHAWTLVSIRNHESIPENIVAKYELARAAIEQTQSDVAINRLAAFSDFARKYIFALAVQNSDYFKKLPEESSHERVRAVCDYYRTCQTDVFPRFVKYPKEPVTTCNLPSYQAQLPEDLPFFLRVPNDPLLILCDTASVLLGA
jgi:hypothetical protein